MLHTNLMYYEPVLMKLMTFHLNFM